MQIFIVDEIPSSMYQSLMELVHASFDEYQKENINFTCSRYSMDDVKEKILSHWCLFAIDEKNNILGVTSFFPINDRDCYEAISAISPKSKGLGIGTLLFERRRQFLQEKKFSRIISDTAVGAKASVGWHLKKCGCRIIGYKSYKDTDYYSYLFCEHLSGKMSNAYKIYYFCRYLLSFCITRCMLKRDGSFSKIGRLISLVKK
ncbi:GNAT family N-acetyltransferase [Fibrobacter sp. UWEL]|uniref:GNAT family N-acetyltransferase n=1 Tax=Fibrobacter sp. UWEL TaxID=1896209 RepID=UPI000920F272|nr:GNAT family N-acetyltransferase [Fibrobacter sp. UWEL]SHK64881.1 Acetyltransferase (GNAT) family protein [Fibrobacter sp. UWEL]